MSLHVVCDFFQTYLNRGISIGSLQDWSSLLVGWTNRSIARKVVSWPKKKKVSRLGIPFVISDPLLRESSRDDRALASSSPPPDVTGAGAATGGGGGGAPPGAGGAGAPP